MSGSASGTLESPGVGWICRIPRTLQPLGWAARALWREAFSFRFHYPIELVPEAGPRNSPHYYVYSDRLFFDAMQLDPDGVPFQRSRTLGTFYNPAYVAWYGLMALERSLRRGEGACDAFQIQTAWLIRNVVRSKDGSITWTYPVDVREGKCELRAPWISVMSQGLALSVLVRAHRLGWRPVNLMELCSAALAVYRTDVTAGGVRSSEEGRVLYEEYPGYPLPRVLDGFLFGLLGLHDVWIETGDPLAKRLFDEGVSGLVYKIDFWDYRDRWSWYGSRRYLCPPSYHSLNRLLLSAVATATRESLLHRYAEMWDPARLTWMDRVRLFVAFNCQKNVSRLKALRGQ